jgi:acetyl esterase/lipase
VSRARQVLVAALSVIAVRALVVRLRALRPVAADLRTPLLFLPLAPGGARRLWVLRRMMQLGVSVPVADGVVAQSRPVTANGRAPTRVVTYERPGRARLSAALLWMHGGGTMIGKAEQANGVCSRWADDLGLFVASVDYRLAPEHPFPAGLDDCYTALCWLHDAADVLGIDRHRIAVGGDSAGGLLAASLCQLARDRHGPPIRFQLLEYPMLDDRTVLRPDPRPERWFVWSRAANRFAWTSYLGGAPTEHDERRYAAPARTPDLTDLPPAWVGVGDIDLFHDEAVEYAARLRAAGVRCELHVEPGMYHGADSIRRSAETSRRFTARMTEALATGVGATRSSRSEFHA